MHDNLAAINTSVYPLPHSIPTHNSKQESSASINSTTSSAYTPQQTTDPLQQASFHLWTISSHHPYPPAYVRQSRSYKHDGTAQTAELMPTPPPPTMHERKYLFTQSRPRTLCMKEKYLFRKHYAYLFDPPPLPTTLCHHA